MRLLVSPRRALSRPARVTSPTRALTGAAALTALALLAGCGPTPDTANTPVRTRDTALVAAACPNNTPTGVTCGRVEAPLGAGAATVSLLVAQVSAPGGMAGALPLLVLPADPAAPAVSDLGRWRRVARQLQHDVIVVDRRGAGGSTPALRCPDADPGSLKVPTAATMAAYTDAMAACATRLRAGGLDPAVFGAAHVADDLDLVRQALGVTRWHVLAGEGSVAAAAALVRSHPDTVASLTVDLATPGSAGPGTAAEADAIRASLRALPSLAPLWQQGDAHAVNGELRARTNVAADPEDGSTTAPATDPPGATVAIDPTALELATVSAARAGGAAAATAVVEAAAQGDAQPAWSALAGRVPTGGRWAAGVAQVTACEAHPVPQREGEVAARQASDLGRLFALADLGSCAEWTGGAGAPASGAASAGAGTLVLARPWTTLTGLGLDGAVVAQVQGEATECVAGLVTSFLASGNPATAAAGSAGCAIAAGTVPATPPPAPATTVAATTSTSTSTTSTSTTAAPATTVPPSSTIAPVETVAPTTTPPSSGTTASGVGRPAPSTTTTVARVAPAATTVPPATTPPSTLPLDVEPPPPTTTTSTIPLDVEDGRD